METHSLTQSQRVALNLKTKIIGWGADLDPADRPGVPMDKAPDLGPEALYPRISPQVSATKIFVSTEHGQRPPIFGTSCPPKGFSGWIRSKAYTISEGRKLRWLMLIVADRVDIVEALFGDLARGKIPNLWKEMGLSSELKYNRKGFAKKVAITAGIGGALYFIFRKKSEN
jgi:hypothetical protein